MTRTLLVLKRSARVARQIVAPNGKHRPRPVELLPDEPIPAPAEPVHTVVLDEDTLEMLLDNGDAVANESAPCPSCERTTLHAMHRDSSRRCWTCATTTIPAREA